MADSSSMQAGRGDGVNPLSPSPLLHIDSQWAPILEYAKQRAYKLCRPLYVFKNSGVWFITKYPPCIVFPGITRRVTMIVDADRNVKNWGLNKAMALGRYREYIVE